MAKQLLVIQTNKEGADFIEQKIAALPDARCQARQIQGQGGEPNAWTVVAELAIGGIGALAAPLLTLIGKGDAVITGEIEGVGKFTCRSVEEFERMVKVARDAARDE